MLFLIVGSFYFTDKVMVYINNKNPIMQEIVLNKDKYKVEAVNAIIEDNTIIPGVNGKDVDVNKSFNKMENYGYFNELYLIYSKSAPLLSLNDYKDKIIIKGNPKKRMISLVIDHNDEVIDYLKQKNIKYTLIGKIEDNIDTSIEYINGESDNKLFSNLNSLLNHKKVNSKLCMVEKSNLELCKKKKYYLFKYSINMDDDILSNINKISSGDIVYISSSVSLNKVKSLLNEIARIDLEINYLSKLISEDN